MDGLDMLWVRWLFEDRLPYGQRPAYRRRRSGSRGHSGARRRPAAARMPLLEGAMRVESAQARAARCVTCLGLETRGYGREREGHVSNMECTRFESQGETRGRGVGRGGVESKLLSDVEPFVTFIREFTII